MSADFTGLTAAVVAGLPEVTACLMVSRDGLPLACHPPGEEHRVLEQWTRLAGLGDVQRGFVEVGGELWVFVRKGAHGALATAPVSGRAGAILVELEGAVRQAEESRGRPRREAAPAGRDGDHGRRRRISLHPSRNRAEAKPKAVDPLDLVREFGGLLSGEGEEEEP